MSSSSEQDSSLASRDFLPHEPLYYAPNSWLKRLRPPSSPLPPSFATPTTERTARPLNDEATSPDALEAELEHAVYEALRRPRDPMDIAEPSGSLGDLDRRIRLISIAGRLAIAIGVSAIVALILVSMSPGLRDTTGQAAEASAGSVQPVKAALNHLPPGNEDATPALCELQTILGPPQSQPAVTHEQSDALLQQFMQWRERPMVTKAP
jgi:hypothetical protein